MYNFIVTFFSIQKSSVILNLRTGNPIIMTCINSEENITLPFFLKWSLDTCSNVITASVQIFKLQTPQLLEMVSLQYISCINKRLRFCYKFQLK